MKELLDTIKTLEVKLMFIDRQMRIDAANKVSSSLELVVGKVEVRDEIVQLKQSVRIITRINSQLDSIVDARKQA